MNINGIVIKTATKAKKGLPKRTGKNKGKGAIAWSIGKRRKEIRNEAQQAAHARNIERGYSEWDLAKAARAAKRG